MKKLLLAAFAVLASCAVFAQGPEAVNTSTSNKKTLSEGSMITVSLLNAVSSKTNNSGDMLEFETSEPLIVGDRVILNKGLKVFGKITECAKARGMGKPGSLTFTIDYLTLEDGRIVKLTDHDIKETGKTTTGAAVTEAVLLTPFFLLKKGKNIEYPKGKTFKVFVAKDYEI
ncbi:hypothetical protein DYU05_04085 [Mucilaginibacter terrenus]|uniref:Uncharacterized protein n=1 Tax=Mucilaginibacter terrenus TaxID=2482727 RepID=A0A3E2NUW4_9SPHI|nr:hypothetical protein [Mucilaginibacter terrenus]RFZ84795.1 hypothetical protein DYU05_04085 [Mucilaginibacter terrenus]